MTSYTDDGYLFPIPVLPEGEAIRYRTELEAAEGFVQTELDHKILFGFANMVLPFVDEISRLPSVTKEVSEILGPDLLVLGASFFLKEPQSPAFVSWHQDLTYWELSDLAEVTAWIALTPATTENGCMQFVRGSHRGDVVAHRDTFSSSNMLSRGQELAIDVADEDAIDVALAAGEMSLHHGHMFHGSKPNTSNDRRIGLALRFIAPSMRQVGGQKTFATLVAGEDRFENFQSFPAPVGVMEAGDCARARESMKRQSQVRL
ncbi:MAG: non-heme Fe2+,alpha-ketoglutarate-dependent halogenase [Verrucomicrobiales bacterium]|jgi:non-heme Fe2+,alpha-ketoglutarate-dependent halogenase